MTKQIYKVGVRQELKSRREPYWARIQRGQYIGFRKLPDGSGTWIARYRTDEGRQKYESLGFDTNAFGYDEAKAAAEAYFRRKENDIKDDIVTVADACRRYVEERRTSKDDNCADDANKRFERTVYGRPATTSKETYRAQKAIRPNPFGERALAKLRAAHIKSWRNGLNLSPASCNRTLIALKAALNLAVRERNVVASQAQEWRDVKPLPGGNNRRDLYLDLDQRRALLAASHGAIRDLIEAAMLTGARAGELVKAMRRQFDDRTTSITLTGKTGTRTVPLSPAAVELFTRLAKNKLPAAFLLVRDDGNPWSHSDWDELVRDAATGAGLRAGVCLYTLRHSFITTALTAGMTTLDVARLVGTSVMMIEKHYGHLVASAARDRLAKVQLL